MRKVLLSLLAGLFISIGNVSYAQEYHSTVNTPSSGSFATGSNYIDLGVGIGSGLNNFVSSYGMGGNVPSILPAFEFSYEHTLNPHFGLGLYGSYQLATSTYSYPSYYNTYPYTNVTYTDTYKESLLIVSLRGTYHFTAGAKFDPYIGINLGYCSIGSSYSTNDPNAGTYNNGSSNSLTGIEYGLYGGLRYFFGNHIGIWAEIQFGSASFSQSGINNGGLYGGSVSISINPCCIGNLGISFKF